MNTQNTQFVNDISCSKQIKSLSLRRIINSLDFLKLKRQKNTIGIAKIKTENSRRNNFHSSTAAHINDAFKKRAHIERLAFRDLSQTLPLFVLMNISRFIVCSYP